MRGGVASLSPLVLVKVGREEVKQEKWNLGTATKRNTRISDLLMYSNLIAADVSRNPSMSWNVLM